MTNRGTPTALSIAGSDPSGGAGIQADLKAFSANGVYGMAALTALTAQNTQGVIGIHLVPPEFVADQIKAVFADIRVDAVKIGMIANAEIATAVAEALATVEQSPPIVLDPVMVAKGGTPLLAREAVSAVVKRLTPIATLVTPNLPEAEKMLGRDGAIAQTTKEMSELSTELLRKGAKAVLIKGGHLTGAKSPDLLATPQDMLWFDATRHRTKNTHGTGCTLSASIAANLAKGQSLADAVRTAKAYVSGAIQSADKLGVGSGHGPTHHFHNLW
ncbi:MAG: bifunctional hydroxymethylpyrimidine kinase/phosphomethylpyrimidine kinase [Rhodobacteraceae bacterium]|nr:bifunctional hydroxymethylpyrimidine kinase/phosphomethylpyrimidine kinase [Paracoccaceae bacterium]